MHVRVCFRLKSSNVILSYRVVFFPPFCGPCFASRLPTRLRALMLRLQLMAGVAAALPLGKGGRSLIDFVPGLRFLNFLTGLWRPLQQF